MKILAFTAGAARMYCGSCLRDNLLASELKKAGHDVVLMPLYTPTRTDEENVSDRRVFMNGISVCLDQEAAFFRKAHPWLDRIWEADWMIRLAAKTSIAVDPHQLGAMTVSMLRGEAGFQKKEIRKLTAWLKGEAAPDIVTLPNSLLIGLAQPVREAMGRPVCCTLQGEELFLSQLLEPYRTQALELLRAKLGDVDGFVTVSQYSAGYWVREFGIPEKKMHVAELGIHAETFAARKPGVVFKVGYLARVAPEKGLHVLAEAVRHLRETTDFNGVLEAAGYLAPEHKKYLRDIEEKFAFTYRGELDRGAKIEFLRGLDVFSVPGTYDEPKGLSILEAMASGVAVVQPRRGAFPEMLAATGGGLLVEPDSVESLADGIYRLWGDRRLAADLGMAGAAGVRGFYSAARMADRALDAYGKIVTHARN